LGPTRGNFSHFFENNFKKWKTNYWSSWNHKIKLKIVDKM
jgi:hypothetical protein